MSDEKWTQAARDFIRANCHSLADAKIARRLSELTGQRFTELGVRKQRVRMGLAKRAGRGNGMR